MKIGSHDNNKPVTPATTGATNTAGAKGKDAAKALPEASATVALSPVANVLVNETNADFDAEKVSRIAQAIRDGKFKVNAEAIADKLIGNAKELLGGSQH